MRKQLFSSILIFILLVSCSVLLFIFQHSRLREPVVIPPSSSEENVQDDKTRKLTCIATIPLEVRLGQKLMAAGYVADIEQKIAAFATNSIGGIIMMDEVPAAQIAALREAMPILPFIAVDQEGGTVQRYKNSGILPGAQDIAANYTIDQAYKLYLADNTFLKNRGLTTNFAPVVDIISRIPTPLPGRMFSSDPSVVTGYAGASIRASKDAGLLPVIKHFPGLGSASGNTDFVTAITDSLSILQSRDLIPYEKLAHLQPDVMVGNMIVPELTNGQPAIWSSEAVELLRSIGYQDAVIYSDSLTAAAIPGDIKDATMKAWAAGIDIAVIVQTDTETAILTNYLQEIIAHAVTAIRSSAIDENTINESVLRIFERKEINPCKLETS